MGWNPDWVYHSLVDKFYSEIAPLIAKHRDLSLIRGLWYMKLLYRPSIHERTFRYRVIIAQTGGQGACYMPYRDADLSVDSYIGKFADEIDFRDPSDYPLKIAVLDSLFELVKPNPDAKMILSGSSSKKAEERADIIMGELLRLIYKRALQDENKDNPPTVLNIGVVGIVVRKALSLGFRVLASDLDPVLVGSKIHGVDVAHGDENEVLIERADVAIVTGMTLSTGTVGRIIERCRECGTDLIMFCETGANFAPEYIKLGVSSVVSEPFPFYIYNGYSLIEVYRAH